MRLFTLEDILKRFGVLPLLNLGRLFADLCAIKSGPGEKISENLVATLRPMVADAFRECERNNLPMCCTTLVRLGQAVEAREKWGVLTTLGDELNARFTDELRGRVFFQISDVARYETPLSGWEDVVTRFPDVQFEIEEASRSFAVARYTASVFHLMRVLEGGLDGIAGVLNPGDHWYSSWEAYLQKLAAAREAKYGDPKDPDHRKWNRFFGDVERNLHAIKVSVRNPVMHKLEKTYTEESAEDVYRQVRALMKLLATELPPPSGSP
jgi:hypothetical protein